MRLSETEFRNALQHAYVSGIQLGCCITRDFVGDGPPLGAKDRVRKLDRPMYHLDEKVPLVFRYDR